MTAVSGPASPLDQHRPVLVYDRDESWRAGSVESFVASGLRPEHSERPTPRQARDLTYARVVRDDGRTWLQYWLFFPYNGQDRGIVRTGRHEGDWEVFQVGLGRDGRPVVATFSQHSSAAACGWEQLDLRRGRPRVHVANGSHALYPQPGVHDRPFPDPNDEARGGGGEASPVVRPISDTRPGWVRLEGRWGASSAGIVPGEQSSPHGPAFSGDRWRQPALFHAQARSCFSAPGGAWWAVPALGGGLLAIVAVAVLTRRRRRGARGPRVTLAA